MASSGLLAAATGTVVKRAIQAFTTAFCLQGCMSCTGNVCMGQGAFSLFLSRGERNNINQPGCGSPPGWSLSLLPAGGGAGQDSVGQLEEGSPALSPPEHRPKVAPSSRAHPGTRQLPSASLQWGNPGWMGRSLPAPECRGMLRAPPAPGPPLLLNHRNNFSETPTTQQPSDESGGWEAPTAPSAAAGSGGFAEGRNGIST
ncbi:collagen alpha-1(II) chain-like [Vidua macroura]|uniref:collagen alpha-1(II) chain-like n=1 Tax=Vidua macroura TaxID=187451 RepID=UPI0023A79880|nr:collagen alpha-1(II) chain-like [Vidua macroura]